MATDIPEETAMRLMAYLDGELPEAERAEFETLLAAHPEWRVEVDSMASMVESEKRLSFRPPPPETWDNYWEEIDSQLSRRTGWFVAGAGSLVLIILGAYKIFIYAHHPLAKVGLALLLIGVVTLFLTVLRGRLAELSVDRYRKIRK